MGTEKEPYNEVEHLRDELKRTQNRLSDSQDRAVSYSAQYSTEREKRQHLERQLEKMKDSRAGRRFLMGVAAYAIAATLTFGQSWHSTCADTEEGVPRVVCSGLMGGFWFITVPVRTSIWLMNPDRPD